jgi:hypothetical protein
MPIEDLIAELRSQGEHETYPPASSDEVQQTESALAVALPPSFRSFVTEFSNGAYLFMLQEVSAVGAGNEQIGPIQDVADGFGGHVPFSLDSNGNAWCFVGDGVAYFDTHAQRLVGELPSFEAWLELLIREQDEVIRVLGFADELGLG